MGKKSHRLGFYSHRLGFLQRLMLQLRCLSFTEQPLELFLRIRINENTLLSKKTGFSLQNQKKAVPLHPLSAKRRKSQGE